MSTATPVAAIPTFPLAKLCTAGLGLSLLVACGATLHPTDNGDPSQQADLAPSGGMVSVSQSKGTGAHGDDGAGAAIAADVASTVTQVNATDYEHWVYLDLDAPEGGAVVSVAHPLADATWDIALRRYHIKTNSGSSGSAGCTATFVEHATFNQLEIAPADPTHGWLTDAEDGPDPDTEPDYAFLQHAGWYSYSQATHLLSPRPRLYLVRTSAAAMVKIELLSYYDQHGTSGMVTFRWAAVAPPVQP